MKVLTSGRFDPPHLGHIVSLLKIAKEYDSLTIVVLDQEERSYPISYVDAIFKETFKYVNHKINVIYNVTHFGELTKEELDSFGCDLYCGGNLQVLKHIENLGFKTKYHERSFDYNASDYKRVAPL